MKAAKRRVIALWSLECDDDYRPITNVWKPVKWTSPWNRMWWSYRGKISTYR